MQTLIDPFELGHSTKAFARSGEHRAIARYAPPVILTRPVRTDFTGSRATLLDVDEITWCGDVGGDIAAEDSGDRLVDYDDEELTLDLDLESEMPRRMLPPRGRGARVWTSED